MSGDRFERYWTVGPGAAPIEWSPKFTLRPGGADFSAAELSIEPEYADRIKALVSAAVAARHEAIEKVCRLAYENNLPWGVLVDCDGVRIDESVPPLTIHYRDTDCWSDERWIPGLERGV